MSDEQIIELYWQRDEAAVSATDGRYGPYCRSIANRILRSAEDARECVNDVWLRAWEAIPPQRPQHLRSFLAKITRNLAFDRFKRDHARKRGGGEIQLALDELEECAAPGSDVEAEVISEELKRSMNRFLRELPEQKRDMFLRRYFYVETTGTIAERYGLKESNVRMILSRTRKELKRHLEQEGFLE